MTAVEIHENLSLNKEFDEFFNSNDTYLDSLWSNCSISDAETSLYHSNNFQDSFQSSPSNSSIDSLLCFDFGFSNQKLTPHITLSSSKHDSLDATISTASQKTCHQPTIERSRSVESNQSSKPIDYPDNGEASLTFSGKDCELEEVISYLWPVLGDKKEQSREDSDSNIKRCSQNLPTLEKNYASCLAADTQLNFPFNESAKSSTNHELEHQLASVDTAWTAALQFPELIVEEFDRILNEAAKKNTVFLETDPTSDNSIRGHTIDDHGKKAYDSSNITSNSCEIKEINVVKDDREKDTLSNDQTFDADSEHRMKPCSDCKMTTSDNLSEETDTGSESEEIRRNQNEANRQRTRKRRRIVIHGNEECVEFLDNESSILQTGSELFDSIIEQSELDWITESRLQNDESKMNAWWPTISNKNRSNLFKSTKKTEIFPLQNAGDSIYPIDNNQQIFKKNRKKYELWEFILKSLNSSQNTAFSWVNKSIGLFRITDTRKAAYEWGRYRGNLRMDYEKMARAMRFYYKDSLLRKGQKQLHFQFAMPFVRLTNGKTPTINVNR